MPWEFDFFPWSLKLPGRRWVFAAPVDPARLQIPDYFDIIQYPMDLGSSPSPRERIVLELLMSDRKIKASTEGSNSPHAKSIQRCLTRPGGTQGQMDCFFSQLPYKCHQNQVASVED